MPLPEVAPLVTKKTLSERTDSVVGWTEFGFVGASPSGQAPPARRTVGTKIVMANCPKLGSSAGLFWGGLTVGAAAANSTINVVGQPQAGCAGWLIVPMRFGSEIPPLTSESYDAFNCLTVRSFDSDGQLDHWWAPKLSTVGWSKIDRKLADIRSFESGWDGEDAAPIVMATLNGAQNLLNSLQVLGAPAPSDIVAYEDGELELQWRNGERFAALSIDNEQRVIAFVRPAQVGEQPLSLQCNGPLRVDLSPFIRALRAM